MKSMKSMKSMTLAELIAKLGKLSAEYGGSIQVICGTDWTDDTWTPDPDMVDGKVWL